MALDSASYRLIADDVAPYIEADAGWPSADVRSDAVRVTYTAGYDTLPQGLRQAILVHAAGLYADRGDMIAGSYGRAIDTLLEPYRIAGTGL